MPNLRTLLAAQYPFLTGRDLTCGSRFYLVHVHSSMLPVTYSIHFILCSLIQYCKTVSCQKKSILHACSIYLFTVGQQLYMYSVSRWKSRVDITLSLSIIQLNDCQTSFFTIKTLSQTLWVYWHKRKNTTLCTSSTGVG